MQFLAAGHLADDVAWLAVVSIGPTARPGLLRIAAIAFDEPRRRLHETEVGRDPGRERCRRQRERQQESGRMFHRGSPFSAAHSIERLLTRLRYDTGMTRRL